MTLNITLVGPKVVTQVSDRRFVDAATHQVCDDSANKSVIVGFKSALVATTFAGVGSFRVNGRTRRMDDWITRELVEAGIPELSPGDLASFLSEKATKLFQAFQKPEAHVFVVAGFNFTDGSTAQAFGLVVTNTVSATPGESKTVESSFHVEPPFIPKGSTGMLVTGMESAVERHDRRRLLRALKQKKDIDSCERVISDAIREIAAKPAADGAIGRDCMATSITASRDCRSTFFSEGVSPHSFGPTVAWTTPMGNAVASNIDALIGPGHRVSFAGGGAGFQLIVGRPRADAKISSAADKPTVSCTFSMSLPKYGPGVEIGGSEQIMTLITPQQNQNVVGETSR